MKKRTAREQRLWNCYKHINQSCSTWNMRDAHIARKRKLTKDWDNFRDFHDEIVLHLGYPKKNQLLVRKDYLKGWTVKNLQWTNSKVRGRQLLVSKKIQYKGKIYSAKGLARMLNYNYYTVLDRLKAGWSITKIVEKPAGKFYE